MEDVQRAIEEEKDATEEEEGSCFGHMSIGARFFFLVPAWVFFPGI